MTNVERIHEFMALQKISTDISGKLEAKEKEEMPHKAPSIHGDIIMHKGELYYINCMDRKEDGQYERPSFDLLSEYLDALAPATQVWVLDAVRKRLNIEGFSVPSKDPT